MRRWRSYTMMGQAVMALTATFALAAAAADAPQSLRVRGTITAVEANAIAVKTREGQELRLGLPADVSVAVARPARFEDIKRGDYLGAATLRRADGALVALELHYLASTVPPGHTAWDLEPGSQMTNATVDAIVESTGARELTVQYPGGSQRIVAPAGIPIVRAVPGTRADLKPGEYVFAAALRGADGTLTAPRLQVSKEGVKPPQ